MVTFALLWVFKKFDRNPLVVRSLLVVMLAATLVMLIYARYGVDYLSMPYIGFFYFAVPSTLAIALVVFLMQFFSNNWCVAFLGVIASIAAFFVSYTIIIKPPYRMERYHGEQVVEINQDLSRIKGSGGRIVLDLDDSNDWSHVWAMVVGIGVNAKRQGESIFCINKNWHISFTKQLQCSPEELANSKRLVVRRSVEGGARVPEIDLGGISFFEYAPPFALASGALTLKKDRDLFSDYLLGSGWTAPDESFTWSVGSRATINLPPLPAGSHVALDLGAFVPVPDSHQRVIVSADGIEQCAVEFTMAIGRQKVEISPAGIGKPIQIILQIEKPISPASVGMGQDNRQLGVALYGIEVSPANVSN